MFKIFRKIVYQSRFLRFFCLSIFVLLSGKTATAQYRFDQWTTDNGLPQNSVYDIVQTRDGYLWLATLDGLARFDGVRFTVFNKSNSPGIVNNRFLILHNDAAHGDLWAGTAETGVTRLHDGHFSSYGIEQGLTKPQVDWIDSDPKNNVLVLSLDSKPNRFAEEKFSPYEEIAGSENQTVSPPTNRHALCRSITGSNQINCFINGRWLNLTADTKISGEKPLLRRAAMDDTGALWLASQDAGLAKFEGSKPIEQYDEGHGLPGTPFCFIKGDQRLSLLSQDEQGAIWLTDLKTMQSEFLMRQIPITYRDVYMGYEDREGNIWLGTYRSGLFRLRKQVITAYSKNEGISDNNINPIFEGRDGTIWIGTTTGLFKYRNGIFSRQETEAPTNVNAIGTDSTGRLLFASSGIRTVENDQVIKIFEIYPAIKIVFAIFGKSDGSLWVGGAGGVFCIKDGNSILYTAANGLAGNEAKIIIDDREGGLWIGLNGGLTHFKDGTFTSWTEKEGLPSQNIRALYLDNEGVLWIGTYDGGLARFKDGKFTGYKMKNGLYNDGAFQILEDGRRNFWISSNRGIYRVSRDELNDYAEGRRSSITSVAYGKSDGMLNLECNGGRSPGGIKAQDGRLWFPTQDGVAVINPETVKINTQPPPVIIESVRIDNPLSQSLVTSSSFTAESVSPKPATSDITIEPRQQNFEIQYTALSFRNSENLRFKYKLENLDSDWIDAGTRRTAYFSHVPAGEYTFRVIAANADGIWNETGASIKIKVLPPFYQTWWFIVLSVLAIAAIAYFLFKRRLVQIEHERLTQQTFTRQLMASQEAERKRIAAELHDSLGQKLVVIKNLALMFLNSKNDDLNIADARQIEEISTEASQAIGEVKTISYNLRPYQLDRIGLTKAVEAIVRTAQAASEIDFTAEIDDIDDYFPKDEEINFYRIVQECVNNIVKHSQASRAEIIIAVSEHALNLTIADNGRGFRFEEGALPNAPSKISSSQPKGFGLIGITERAELLGGKIEIKSASEQGTTIKISIKSER